MDPQVQPLTTGNNDPAVASFGTVIQVLSSAAGVTPETYITIEGLGDIEGPSRSIAEHETTSHSTGTPVRTFIPSLHDPGTLGFPVYYNPTFATHSPYSTYGLEYLYWNRIVTKWRLVGTDPTKRTREFWGFVSELGETYPVAGIAEWKAKVRISGAMTDIVPQVTLSPTSASPTAPGGAATVTVTVAGGSTGGWFPVSDSSWITIQSPTTVQTASGPVNYTVAAQQAGAPARTGHITIGSTVFNVSQAAG